MYVETLQSDPKTFLGWSKNLLVLTSQGLHTDLHLVVHTNKASDINIIPSHKIKECLKIIFFFLYIILFCAPTSLYVETYLVMNVFLNSEKQ